MIASLMFPTTATLAEIGDSQTHQNKNENIIVISQGNIELAENLNSGRKRLSLDDLSLKTIRETGIEKSNSKRLAHYKPRLDSYIPLKGEMSILVTGYSSTPDQTWGNPFITASGTHVHNGTMACPPQYPFGTKIKIQSMGTFVCEDRGGMIKGNHFDMWFTSRAHATHVFPRARGADPGLLAARQDLPA